MAEYIEREEIIAYIDRLLEKKADDSDSVAYFAFERFRELLKLAPAADAVEVRHGYWDDNIIGFCNVCMECGAIVERAAIKSHTGA